MQKHLLEGLTELNNWLNVNNAKIVLHVIGGFGIALHNINIKRVTQDIDNVNPIEDKKIIEQIHNIGEQRGNPEWFDFSALTIDLPDGYQGRLVKVDGLSNIDIFILHLRDIVVLKVAAYFSRKERGIVRDLEDLIAIDPTFEEVCQGLDFIIQKQGVEQKLPKRFMQELREDVAKLKEELREYFK